MNMKLSSALFAAVTVCLLHTLPASAAEPIGKVVAAKTSVSSSGAGGKKELKVRDDVFFMDRLTTNATGIGEFMFDDGTKLALGPSASLVVDRFVQKNETTFQKLGVKAAKGTFRWVSGKSPSSAYQIKTPMGTMGVRGTAFDVSTRGGRTHVVLLNGKATFCAGAKCAVLSRTGDYISSDGSTVSPTVQIGTAFKNRREAARVFPFLANPSLLSAKFRVRGSYLFRTAFGGPKFDQGRNGDGAPRRGAAGGDAPPGGGGDGGGGGGGGGGGAPGGGGGNPCGGNCGNGNGGGGGNGTGDEGGGNDP